MVAALYVLVFLAIIQGLISLRDGWRNMRYAETFAHQESTRDAVVVFCPVKGLERNLESNVRSLLEQRHPDYRVVFIVDSPDEPALEVLSGLRNAEVLVAGFADGCGQKVHSLAEGVRTLQGSPDILVFADADAQFPPEWLSNLVAPLSDPRVGASTGYRWYVPARGNLAGLIRSAWNATVVGFLGPHPNNFVWGGSTAIRREVFERIHVIERWEGALSDDYALTAAVRAAGLDIVYVPACLVPSHGECSWRSLIEFTTRQIRITRVYAPRVWRLGLITYSLFNVTFLWLTLAMLSDALFLLPWLGIYTLSVLRADLRLRGVVAAMGDASVPRYKWFHRLAAPVTALLYQLNFLSSMLSRRLVWKSVTYTLISPNETRIENR